MTHALAPRIAHMKPCREAVRWLGDRDLATAWTECKNPQWMLWLAGRLVPRPTLVRCCVAFVREIALPHVPPGEDRPWYATEVALAWCDGRATLGSVRAAARLAAAYAAATYAAATYAAATYAVAYAYAADDAAAHAAAYAAAYAVGAACAVYEARIAEIVREWITVGMLEEGLSRGGKP